MAVDDAFDQMAADLVEGLAPAHVVYTQGATDKSIHVDIQRNVDTLDEFGAVTNVAYVAVLARAALGFQPIPTDTILVDGGTANARTYTVQRVIEDDGYLISLAIT